MGGSGGFIRSPRAGFTEMYGLAVIDSGLFMGCEVRFEGTYRVSPDHHFSHTALPKFRVSPQDVAVG